MISLYVNNESTNIIPSNGNYYLDDSNSKCFNTLGTVEDNDIEYDNDTKQISISKNDKPLFCKVYLLSGRKVNVLVSNGILVEGNVVANEIYNGNFEDDLTNWGDVNLNYISIDDSSEAYFGSAGTKSLKNTGTALPQQGITWYIGISEDIQNAIHIKSNNRYYVSFYTKNTSSCDSVSHFIMGNKNIIIQAPPANNVWKKYSGSSDSGKERKFSSDYTAISWVAANDCGGIIWTDDVMFINMTDAFGKMNENEYSKYKILLDQMPYFEPFGSVLTSIKPTSSVTYEVWPYRNTFVYLYETPTVVSGNCSINGNTISVPPGNADVTCVIRYS